MERYRFSESEQALMEGLMIPFAVFQLVDEQIVMLVVSNGFCELLGSRDRAAVYADMNRDTYRYVHPDDIARLGNAVLRFMRDDGRLGKYRTMNDYKWTSRSESTERHCSSSSGPKR